VLPDSHFSRRNRNASWILSYPRNPRDNPDEILRAMKPSEVRRMEAEVLGNQLMEALEKEPELADKLEAAVDKKNATTAAAAAAKAAAGGEQQQA
jgi:urease accessory protein UreF